MATRRLDRDDDEMRAIEMMEAERVMRSASAHEWTPAVVERASAWRAYSPWLDPGAVMSLSKSGIDPRTDTGAQVARAAVKVKGRNRGLGWHTIGDVVDAAAEKAGGAASAVATGIGTGVRGVARGAFTALDAPIEAASGMLREDFNNWRRLLDGDFGEPDDPEQRASGLNRVLPDYGNIARQTTPG